MSERFFETNFEFEKYINERLLEVSDEDDRRALKDVCRGVLVPFYQNTEEAYQLLAKRMEATKNTGAGRYEIITTLSKKNMVDTTDEAMFPMNPEDLEPQEIDVEDMWEALEQGQRFPVMKIYVQLDYDSLRKLIISRREWKGTIYTEDGEYQAKLVMTQNHSYQNQIQELYDFFSTNQIPWKVVCAPYLAKFFDVEVLQTDCPKEEEITRITVNFEEFSDKIYYDLVPLWNIRMFEERTSAYPSLALDQIHYEHCIFKERIHEKSDYLIHAPEVILWNIYRMDGDIHIICDADQPVKFTLIEFGYEADQKGYEYPFFRNSSVVDERQACIHTVAEVKRVMKGYGYEDWFELKQVKQQGPVEKGKRYTYNLNEFIEDEIRTSALRNSLVFVFEQKKPGNVLNQDVMSYLISRIQWAFPEFECIGENK